jgi:hypothetical protein
MTGCFEFPEATHTASSLKAMLASPSIHCSGITAAIRLVAASMRMRAPWQATHTSPKPTPRPPPALLRAQPSGIRAATVGWPGRAVVAGPRSVRRAARPGPTAATATTSATPAAARPARRHGSRRSRRCSRGQASGETSCRSAASR